jgi:voltage-gated potassium channel
MARMALHPQVGGTLEVADLRMEEIEVTPACTGVGKSIEEVRGQTVIVALRRQGGALEAQPAPQTLISEGDMLVALGSPAELERLEGNFQPTTS